MRTKSIYADSSGIVSCPIPKHFSCILGSQLCPCMHFSGRGSKQINSLPSAFQASLQASLLDVFNWGLISSVHSSCCASQEPWLLKFDT